MYDIVCMAIVLRNAKFYTWCVMETWYAYTATIVVSRAQCTSTQVGWINLYYKNNGQCALQSHYVLIAIVH